ncbi:TonB-dependent receptor plug domain-containing protein, partial [Steroidobacter sp.]|uniref:TonB-dependent receptor plug domain-containing protein n=1 Tax=Steroidobacter sp. TaxID=1978227 RepID=UPI001A5EB79E
TNNGIQRPQAALIAAQGEPYASAVRNIGKVVQRYGLPEQETKKAFVNFGYNLTDSTQLYSFGSFADDTGVADFNYRPSLTVTGPNADGTIVTFARNGAYNIKSNGRHSIYQTAGTDGVNTWAATDPNFNLLSIYPGGFTPRFGSDTRDWSFVTGVKGDVSDKLSWDLSASTGSNRIDYWLKESINLSLGSLSPTEFDNGGREQREQNANLDFVYQWQTAALDNPINVGFGLEYRREEFRINAGEYASWAVGPLRDLSPAANGFPGAHPATAGVWDSHNTAAYIDFDLNLTDRLNVGLAGRFEDYSLFGTTTNGKLAARFELTKAVSLRGAVSTGFRAPTPGQQYLQNIGQNPNVNPLVSRSVDVRAQLPSNSQAAALFGGKALTPEESVNLSLGVVLQPFAGTSITLDAYRIDVNDRIGLSTAFELTQVQREQLVAANVPLANELTHVSFYTNSFDTRTTGLDLVANWQGSVGPGALGLTLASNYNYTEYLRFDPRLIDAQARTTFLKTIPRFTSHLSADYGVGKWRFTGRGRHFGEWTYVASTSVPYVYEQIGSETFLDLIGSYEFSDSVDITLGVENVLDNYIQEVGLVTVRNNGRRYPGGAPYENEGRQVYARVGIRF